MLAIKNMAENETVFEILIEALEKGNFSPNCYVGGKVFTDFNEAVSEAVFTENIVTDGLGNEIYSPYELYVVTDRNEREDRVLRDYSIATEIADSIHGYVRIAYWHPFWKELVIHELVYVA